MFYGICTFGFKDCRAVSRGAVQWFVNLCSFNGLTIKGKERLLQDLGRQCPWRGAAGGEGESEGSPSQGLRKPSSTGNSATSGLPSPTFSLLPKAVARHQEYFYCTNFYSVRLVV